MPANLVTLSKRSLDWPAAEKEFLLLAILKNIAPPVDSADPGKLP
jgi:hypothetical protein